MDIFADDGNLNDDAIPRIREVTAQLKALEGKTVTIAISRGRDDLG